MTGLILTTYDWVPPPPRGYVRDIRVRWALEEAGLPYTVASTPFNDRPADHIDHQPFNQVPWLTDDGVTWFESGAILQHIGEINSKLLPAAPQARADALSWLWAALNSVEAATLPWSIFIFSNLNKDEDGGWQRIDGFVQMRLARLEDALKKSEWLAGSFSVADILMADVLRLVDRFDGLAKYPACKSYVTRATSRPAFQKAHADQLAHFAKGDSERA